MTNITTVEVEDNEEFNERQLDFEASIDAAEAGYDKIQDVIDGDLHYWNKPFEIIRARLVSTGGY